MAVTKKKASAVAAVAVAAALALGGTFAWQSISQTALNEASDIVNPGGRLHDDFDGSNKDVYVENFADDRIFARVKLQEYFEFVMNPDTDVEKAITVAGEKADDGTVTYATHYFGQENATDEWWEWATGGSTTYMPTFNKNKDSLKADVNGTYESTDEDGNRYADYVKYADGEEVTAYATYDADSNSVEDETVNEVEETHTAKSTLGATLMSMQEWINAGFQPGDYWVYDSDGWVYWANAIEPGTATGLLLDGIEPAQVFDDSWYYAINVVAQFVTADDLGRGQGTGFYSTEDGNTAPTDEALALLEAIGVDVTATVSDDESLSDALASYGDVEIDGTIKSTDTETEDGISFYYDYLWHDGGTVSGGAITSETGAYTTLFINVESNWPEDGDGASAAFLEDTSITSNASFAVYAQAINADIVLTDVTVNAAEVGVYAEWGDSVISLNNVTVTTSNRNAESWRNAAVAAVNGANIVINGGSYAGEYAVYIYDGTEGPAKVTISGGYFDGKLACDNGTLTISGGTFTVNPSAYVADGCEAVDNGDGTWTVQEKQEA